MDEEQASLKYHYDRILIESSRIITPTLPGCTLVLNGAQVEMLRNCAHYLDRRYTFVSEYGELTYETPDDDDWDDIRAQVADLEEKLMGNENTIFGVYERWVEWLGGTKTGDGEYSAISTPVPVGYVYVCQSVSIQNNTSARGRAAIGFSEGAHWYYLKAVEAPVTSEPVSYNSQMVLSAGDTIRVFQALCLDGDVIGAGIWGYSMKIPA